MGEGDDLLALGLDGHAGGDQVDVAGAQRRDQARKGLVGQHHLHAQLVGDGLRQLHVKALQLLLAGLRVGVVELIGREADACADDNLALRLNIGEHIRLRDGAQRKDHRGADSQRQELLHHGTCPPEN